jgi:adenosylcobinamide-GDP ribazoletransferase
MLPLLRAPLAAVAFLTRIPVGRPATFDAHDVARGAVCFPLVGGLLGLAAGGLADTLVPKVPALLAGALAVGLASLLSGAMHLDALADTADALGGATRERALEIMRDHAVGTYGTLALVLVVLVDAACLGALAGSGEATLAALAAGALGRGVMLPLGVALPYARAGGGQGRVLEGVGRPAVVVGLALACALAAPLGWDALAGIGVAGAAALGIGLYARRWLGGVTGDVLGCAAKLGETAVLVALVAAL